MRCPKCGNVEDRVIDSRPVDHFAGIRRRRVCLKCEHRFTTYEEAERIELRVVKRDGRVEGFDRGKLLHGMEASCMKRPVKLQAIEQAVDEIIAELEMENEREIPARLIGIKVMERLHALDEVAYVRFASVYRHFQEVGDFIDEIKQLAAKPRVNGAQPDLFNGLPR